MTEQELTTQEFWKNEFWNVETGALPDVKFDPQKLEYRDFHRLCRRWIDLPAGARCLEVGCAPGRYLWYFATQFQFDVSGIEYVPEAAALTQSALEAAGVAARIDAADLFQYSIPDAERFDLVCSFGLVEHFRDISGPIESHARLVAPGGLLFLTVPYHRGLNGWLLRRTAPESYAMHNQMNWPMLRDAVQSLADFKILWGGYWGHFNLAPTNFLAIVRDKAPYRVYWCSQHLHNVFQRCRRVLPNNRWTAPYVGIIARKNL